MILQFIIINLLLNLWKYKVYLIIRQIFSYYTKLW